MCRLAVLCSAPSPIRDTLQAGPHEYIARINGAMKASCRYLSGTAPKPAALQGVTFRAEGTQTVQLVTPCCDKGRTAAIQRLQRAHRAGTKKVLLK